MEDVRGQQVLRYEHLRQRADDRSANLPSWGARNAQRQSSALLSWKLDEFFNRYVAVPKASVERARSSAAREFVKSLQPRLDSNKYTIKFRNAILHAGGCHGLPARQQVSSMSVVYLPLRISKCRSRLAEPGYCHVSLPKAPQYERYAVLRSEDNARLLSPMAAYRMCHELVCHHAKSVDGVRVLPLLCNTSDYGEGTTQIVAILADGHRVEIVPSLLPRSQDGRQGALIVAKPYCHDVNPQSDVLWRYSFRAPEAALMQSVSMADGGVRVRSVAILLTLFDRDRALSPLGPYAVQTLVLQSIDKDVEGSLTWQRDRQHDCVLSALHDCLECVQRKHLSHFFISNFNVLQAVPDEVLTRLGRRLARLLKNPNELLRQLEASLEVAASPAAAVAAAGR